MGLHPRIAVTENEQCNRRMNYSTTLLLSLLSMACLGCSPTSDNPSATDSSVNSTQPQGMGEMPSRAMSFTAVESDISGIQRSLREGSATCEQIVSAFLARIEFYDAPSGLNAITVTNPNALQRAREIDQALASGDPLGSLFCAPLLIKDNFDTHDLPTTGGSIALMGSLPPDDAFMVQQLRLADAIVLAKTNMAEWAFSARQTVSSSFGTTANAYALDRVPAGSSGGTASATAASFAVAGMGTDTGNSIRGPASHLALFGIRASLGLTSRDGIIPLVFDRDVAGPLTRTVRDGALLFNVISGYDPADPYTAAGKGRQQPDYTEFLQVRGLVAKRVGVLRALVNTQDADPEITLLFEAALNDMARAGADIVDPLLIDNLQTHLEGDYFCPRFRFDVHNYLKSLVEPTDTTPFVDVTDVLKSGKYSPYIKERLEYFGRFPLDVSPEHWDEPCPEYLHHPGRIAYLKDVVASMDKAGVDVLVYPTWTSPPAHLNKAREEYRGDNSQLIAPATGMPAATVPMGYSHGNLPAGLQILARPYDEGTIFSVAYAYEQATKHRHPPAGFPALETATTPASHAED